MSATHEYEPCAHKGRHGYTLPGEPEFEFCDRCRQPERARCHATPEPEDETLGSCGCTDYHMADCPTRDVHYDDAPDEDEDEPRW